MKLDEAGKMLGGWNGQLTKQNSPRESRENEVVCETANANPSPRLHLLSGLS